MAGLRRRYGARGLTLLEVLIAIAILGLLIAIAYSAIVQGLRVQSSQEAAVSTQARLRRIAEVFTQEMRSAVLGAVSDEPYESNETAVSFTLLDGGAGYQVIAIDSGANAIEAVTGTPSSPWGAGDQMMVVDAGGTAAIFTLSSQSNLSGGVFRLSPQGGNCFSGMVAFDPDDAANRGALLFRVKTLGLRYDADSETLFMTEGDDDERPLAFDVRGLELSYVYREPDGTLHTFDEPLRVGGHPARNTTFGSAAVELARLQVRLEGTGRAVTGEVARNYVAQVELGSNQTFIIKAVSSCS